MAASYSHSSFRLRTAMSKKRPPRNERHVCLPFSFRYENNNKRERLFISYVYAQDGCPMSTTPTGTTTGATARATRTPRRRPTSSSTGTTPLSAGAARASTTHSSSASSLVGLFFVNCRAPRFQPLMFTGALGRCQSRKQTGDIAALVFLASSFLSGFRRDVGSNPRPPFRGS